MIVGYLLIGIITAIFSAATALLLGHGPLIAFVSYSLGGIAGMLVFFSMSMLQRTRRTTDMAAIKN